MTAPDDLLAHAFETAADDDARRRVVLAGCAVVEEALPYVTDDVGYAEMALTTLRGWCAGRCDAAEVRAQWASHAATLARVERGGEQAAVDLAWATWHLGRVVVESLQGNPGVAVRRLRDVVRMVLAVVTWAGPADAAADDPAALRERAATRAAASARLTQIVRGVLGR